MINTTIKLTNIESVDGVQDYIDKKIAKAEKYLSESSGPVFCEISKVSHSQSGEVYRVEFRVSLGKRSFYAEAVTSAVLASVDEASEKFIAELQKNKGKSESRFLRGAAKVKRMLKGDFS